MQPAALPNLLYLANVPAECSYHGSALMYRLLQGYPPEKLCLVESLHHSLPERRLPGVRYTSIRTTIERLTRTRFAALYSSLQFLRAASWIGKVEKAIAPFKPEAVLTVAHGPLWVTAAAYAKAHRLPLHLICHDEITKTVMHVPRLTRRIAETFGEVYRSATSRLCVSPYMRDDYRARFQADAEVLYPARAADVPKFTSQPEHLTTLSRGLRVAFAGTINMGGHVVLLKNMASALEAQGGRLLLYGPITKEAAAQSGLVSPNIEIRGLLTSNQLIHALRTEADALYVPMSFDPADRLAMKTNFPSKLTDYTAVGLPIIIQGPHDSSAISWANENPGVALAITSDSSAELSESLKRLSTDPDCRLSLGRNALEVGARYFDASVAHRCFESALSMRG